MSTFTREGNNCICSNCKNGYPAQGDTVKWNKVSWLIADGCPQCNAVAALQQQNRNKQPAKAAAAKAPTLAAAKPAAPAAAKAAPAPESTSSSSDSDEEDEDEQKKQKEEEKKKKKKKKKHRAPSPSDDEPDWQAAPPPSDRALDEARQAALPAVIEQYFGDASMRQTLAERIRQSRGAKESLILHQADATRLVTSWNGNLARRKADKDGGLSVSTVRQVWVEIGALTKSRATQHMALEGFFTSPPPRVPPTTAIWAESSLAPFPAQLLIADAIPNSAGTAPIVDRRILDIIATRMVEELWTRYGAQSVAHEGRRQHLWLAVHCCKQCPTEPVSNFKDRFARHVQALQLDPGARGMLPDHRFWQMLFADNLLPAVRAGAALSSKTEIDWTQHDPLKNLGLADAQARASGELPPAHVEDYDSDTLLRLELLDATPPVLARLKQALKPDTARNQGAPQAGQQAGGNTSPNFAPPARGGGGHGRGRGRGRGSSSAARSTDDAADTPPKPEPAPAATLTPPTCWNCGEKHSFYNCGRPIDQVRSRNSYVAWAKNRFRVDIKAGDPIPPTAAAFQALKEGWKAKSKN